MRLAKVGEKAYVCDIAGFIGTAAAEVLAGMLRVLKRRGPDNEGVWVGLGIGRGMRWIERIRHGRLQSRPISGPSLRSLTTARP